MSQERIMVSSITHAIRGRDLLRGMGFKAYIERSRGQFSERGCGYNIYVDGDIARAEQILTDNQIRILGRSAGDWR